MDEERVVIKGFCRREEEETPIYEEEHFIPLGDEPEEGGINLTWILWTFAIVIFLILGVTATNLTYNIINYNKLKQIEQTINNEQGRS